LAAASLATGAGPFGMQLPSPLGNVITIWNAEGQFLRTLRRARPFFENLDTFAFVANDKQIAAPASIDSDTLAFSVFDLATGEIVHEVAGPHPDKPHAVNRATALVASPDQSILAVAFGPALAQPVALYSTRDWSKLADLPEVIRDAPLDPAAFAFSPDGRFLAVGRVDSVVFVYDVSSRQVLQRFKSFPERLTIRPLAFSPDGRMIAVASPAGLVRRPLPDGTSQIVSPGNRVRVFHRKDGAQIATYPQPFDDVGGLAWSPDGRFIAFVMGSRILHLWDPLSSEQTERTIEVSSGPNSHSLAFSPDGATLV